jgi:hypothetical protein
MKTLSEFYDLLSSDLFLELKVNSLFYAGRLPDVLTIGQKHHFSTVGYVPQGYVPEIGE